jgi:hypothetical protein
MPIPLRASPCKGGIKNMRKKQTFEEFAIESRAKSDALKEKLSAQELQIKQQEHRMQRAENLVEYVKGSKRKRRNKRLIRKGVAIEAVCPDTKYLEEMEFFHLMEKFFENKELLECIAIMVAGRQEQEEEEQRLLEKAEANMKAGGGS